METADWIDLLDDDDDDDDDESCLTREACAEVLVRDEPAGCLYCRLRDWGEEDDE